MRPMIARFYRTRRGWRFVQRAMPESVTERARHYANTLRPEPRRRGATTRLDALLAVLAVVSVLAVLFGVRP